MSAPPSSPSSSPSWAPPSLDSFSWRLLSPQDREQVDALHRRAIGALGPDVVKPEGPGFFARILEGGGRIIGVFDAGRLVAYGVLQHLLPDTDDPRPLLGLPPDMLRVKLAGASVVPEMRGRGLQRALVAARVALAQSDFPGRPMVLYSTSAPANFASWANLMAEGFAIRAVKLYYGGHPRYVMVHDDGQWQRGTEMSVEPGDLDRQRALLAQGWRGVGQVKDAAGGLQVVFAAPRLQEAPAPPQTAQRQ